MSPTRRGLLQLGLVAGWPGLAGATSGPGSLRAATFNLRYDTPRDGPDAWPHRRDGVRELIRRLNLDLLATQEGLAHQIADLEQLGEFARVGVGRDDGKSAGEHSALFFRRSRFERLDSGDFWLSETPDVPSRGWDARCCFRLTSWARLRDREAAADAPCWRVISVHFDHEGERARLESARLILRWLAQHAGGDRVLLMGDFNALPESAAMAVLGERLRDAFAVSESAPVGPVGTFQGFGREALTARIDQVWVDGGAVRVLSYRAVDERLDSGRWPSDHVPVLVELLAR